MKMENGGGVRAAIARWLSSGWEDEPYRPPTKRTWAEKVTDDSNAWLAARGLELDGDLQGAALSYARDADFWESRGHLARAALSTACEARCLARGGMNGVHGYERAGDLYVEAGRLALRDDPRAALQLFDRARVCFDLAGRSPQAREAAGIAESLQGALDADQAYG
jgi:hypothetical protein